jgi:hypothetical protein
VHLVPAVPHLLAELCDGIEDLAVRAAAPIAIGFRSGFFVAGEFADGLVHNVLFDFIKKHSELAEQILCFMG